MSTRTNSSLRRKASSTEVTAKKRSKSTSQGKTLLQHSSPEAVTLPEDGEVSEGEIAEEPIDDPSSMSNSNRAARGRNNQNLSTSMDTSIPSEELMFMDPMDNSIEEEVNSDGIRSIPMLKKPRRELVTSGKSVLISEPSIMLKSIEYRAVLNFRDEWCLIAPEIRKCMDLAQHIAPELHPPLRNILHEGWEKMDEKDFFASLLQWIPRSNEQSQVGQTAEERLLALRLNFTGMSLSPAVKFLTQFHREFQTWQAEHTHLSEEERAKRTSKLISSIIDTMKKKSSEKSVIHELAIALELHGTFKNPDEFGVYFLSRAKDAILTVAHAIKFGMAFGPETGKSSKDSKGMTSSKSFNSNRTKFESTKGSSHHKTMLTPKASKLDEEKCTGCGRRNHSFQECNLSQHPDFNNDSKVAWSDSPSGKAWATFQSKEGKPFYVLPRNLTLEKMKTSKQSFGNNNHKKNGYSKSCSLLALTSDVYLNEYYPFPYIRGEITHVEQQALLAPVQVKVLLDTGALHSNYISSALIQELRDNNVDKPISVKPAEKLTISADESIIECKGSIVSNVKLRNFTNSEICLPSLTFHIIPMMYDIIIGLQIIKKYDLIITHFPKLFSPSEANQIVQDVRNNMNKHHSSSEITSKLDTQSLFEQQLVPESFATSPISSSGENIPNMMNEESQQSSRSEFVGESYDSSYHKSDTLSAANSMNVPMNHSLMMNKNILLMIKEKEDLLGLVKDLSGEESIKYEEDVMNEMFSKTYTEMQIIDLITISSPSEEMNNKIRNLCRKYISVFRKELNPNPALIPPFDINVSKDIWERNENRLPPRKQGPNKEKEIWKQINEMLKHGVIRPSQATEYSQVLLTAKPGGEWRFCIDYRRLNEATKQIGWPLPNIKAMLHRLGEKKIKFFGKMDLTKGYFQAPLAEASRKYSAFITYCGIYEWLRVPMGLKGAPAYFQFMIATVVLTGLLYICCELYIDDVVVFGKDEDEFLLNLEKVLQRLKEKNVSLNPKKCILGATSIEFVGHVIDETGLRMSEEKIKKVINFKQPMIAKGLKSFLGLANYFRDHIHNHSKVVQPLQQMIKNYKKNHKLQWNSEATNAFHEIKSLINACPKIFFVQDDAPIYLHTDASKYAVGAYLFQVVNNKEYPIAFLSQTLTNSQLNWSTFEKEAYAIFYAFQELEYLLNDRYFTLRTDHANLTYIRDSGSEKVRRWKLYIQEYNFDIEHIPGEKNIVADALTRLVEEPPLPDHLLYLAQDSVIPPPTYRAIGKCHNSTVGHHGVQRTLAKLKAMNYNIKYLPEFVRLFVQRCPACQKMSQIKPVIETIPFTTAAYAPMHRLNMDTIGPLPESVNGHKFILVIIDCFSRWVELYKCHSTEAEEAARHLLDFVGRYGCPREIVTDNGSQFVNDVINHFVKLFGTEHMLSIP